MFISDVAKCTCNGDPHCASFDGKWSHFQGTCHYLAARDNCKDGYPEGEPSWEVIVNNDGTSQAATVSYVMGVLIKLKDYDMVSAKPFLVVAKIKEAHADRQECHLGICCPYQPFWLQLNCVHSVGVHDYNEYMSLLFSRKLECSHIMLQSTGSQSLDHLCCMLMVRSKLSTWDTNT